MTAEQSLPLNITTSTDSEVLTALGWQVQSKGLVLLSFHWEVWSTLNQPQWTFGSAVSTLMPEQGDYKAFLENHINIWLNCQPAD